MENFICTFYSHYIGFEKITAIARRIFINTSLSCSENDQSQILLIEEKGGFFKAGKKFKITYRQRNQPSYQIPEIDDSALTANLKGLYGYINSLPTTNEKVKDLLLQKVLTLNSEFSILHESGDVKELRVLIQELAQDFDAVLFVQPGTIISKSKTQHFLDSSLNLIIDGSGNCDIEDLPVNIESKYFDGEQLEITEDQKERKARSEAMLKEEKIKINYNLPFIESEIETTIRPAKEIAQRVSILAVINLVSFNDLEAGEAIGYLQDYHLWDYVTPKEKSFLADPTDAKKNQETWKCECIWTLLWALKTTDSLGWPNELCNLSNIESEKYPIAQNKDPNDFINAANCRTKAEIMDANDLYYRLDWACVDARINNVEIQSIHPGVVYERHYALNWLVNYMDQGWDDVSCDT